MADKQVSLYFKEIDLADPKIKISDDSIKIIPTYFNYVFLLNFIPLFAGVYVLTQQNDLKINLGCFFLIGLSLFAFFFDQLPFYNTTIINIVNKTITIKPNILRSLFIKKKTLTFNDIQNINFTSRGFGASHVRYGVKLKLRNSIEEKLITTSKNDNAVKLVNAIRKIIIND